MSYNYKKSIKEDIREYIRENIADEEIERLFARKDIETLSDIMWCEDSITGSGSGSYTFNSMKAKEYVLDDGLDYLRDMLLEGWYDYENFSKIFMDENWEHYDVSIRCYLLWECIGEVLDEGI